MANLSVGKKNKTGDNWYTPKSAFQDIAHLIPKNKTIYEPFYGDGMSGKYLTELGFTVHHENLDFFKRLRELDVPFMLLLPVSCITKQYTKKYFLNDLQMVIPSKRIHFVRGGEQSKSSWFDVCWLCYKMGFPRDITYL